MGKNTFFGKFFSFNWAAWISAISNYLMFCFVAFILCLLVLERFDVHMFEITQPYDFFFKSLPYIFVIFVVRVYSKDVELMKMATAALEQKHGVIDVIDDPSEQITSLLEDSKNVCVLTLSGSNIHSDDKINFLEAISARRIKSFSIAIANPFSDAIRERYARDEPTSARSGPEKIKETILEMHQLLQQVPAALKSKIEIRLYENYPTQSIFTADGEVLVSAYGFKLRKSDTPTTYTRSNTRLGLGVQKHFDEVFKTAQPLSDWICEYYDELSEIMPIEPFDHYSGVFISTLKKDTFVFQRRGKSKGIENPGLLSVFGGRREADDRDDPKITAIRELKEETGIMVNMEDIQLICQIPYVPNNATTDVVLGSYYKVENINVNDMVIAEGKAEKHTLARAAGHADMTSLPRLIIKEKLVEKSSIGTDGFAGAI